jgi:hypothetical protein
MTMRRATRMVRRTTTGTNESAADGGEDHLREMTTTVVL